jgi:hypothetical protein
VLIEAYFAQIEADIAQCVSVMKTELLRDKRSPYIGFIEGKMSFINSSMLHFIEFVNVKTTIDRYKYSYHYQASDTHLVFRYDMVPHHKDIVTFPHHKHIESGDVIESFAPTLKEILEEIEKQHL